MRKLTQKAGRLGRWAYNTFRSRRYQAEEPPASYRVVAFLPIFNEADIIEATLRRLAESGVQAYVLDNWSTDGTWELVQRDASRNLLGAERIPPEGLGTNYDLQRTSERITELSAKICPDWSLWHDADEYFQAPWASMTLRSALFRVEQERYNAISFYWITFPPVDNSFQPGSDFVGHFKHWSAYYPSARCVWVRGWKGNAKDVRVWGGSHDVDFAHRYIYPKKFVIRHYPIRSQEHGAKKLFRERLPRYAEAEIARGWHIQYKDIAEGSSFLKKQETLHPLNEKTFLAEVGEHRTSCKRCFPFGPPARRPKRNKK